MNHSGRAADREPAREPRARHCPRPAPPAGRPGSPPRRSGPATRRCPCPPACPASGRCTRNAPASQQATLIQKIAVKRRQELPKVVPLDRRPGADQARRREIGEEQAEWPGKTGIGLRDRPHGLPGLEPDLRRRDPAQQVDPRGRRQGQRRRRGPPARPQTNPRKRTRIADRPRAPLACSGACIFEGPLHRGWTLVSTRVPSGGGPGWGIDYTPWRLASVFARRAPGLARLQTRESGEQGGDLALPACQLADASCRPPEKSLWELLRDYDPNGLVALDSSMRIQVVNPAFCRMFRVDPQAVIGQPGRRSWAPGRFQEVLDRMSRSSSERRRRIPTSTSTSTR